MSFQLSAQAITAHTAITRMSVSRCSILPRQRGSTTAPKCPTSRSIAMLRSPTFGEEDHPWLSNSPASGISCVAPGGCYVPGRGMSAGGVMRWRVVLELAGADGTRQVHEIGAGERPPTGHTAATLGLGLAESKAILAALQRHLVTAQADEHCRDRRRCDRCGAQRPLKDWRPRRLASLFGVVAVRAPRFDPCWCGVACRRSMTPVAEIMPDRRTPEYERVVAAMGAALPYRRALAEPGLLPPPAQALLE